MFFNGIEKNVKIFLLWDCGDVFSFNEKINLKNINKI